MKTWIWPIAEQIWLVNGHELFLLFWFSINTTGNPLGQYKPSTIRYCTVVYSIGYESWQHYSVFINFLRFFVGPKKFRSSFWLRLNEIGGANFVVDDDHSSFPHSQRFYFRQKNVSVKTKNVFETHFSKDLANLEG